MASVRFILEEAGSNVKRIDANFKGFWKGRIIEDLQRGSEEKQRLALDREDS